MIKDITVGREGDEVFVGITYIRDNGYHGMLDFSFPSHVVDQYGVIDLLNTEEFYVDVHIDRCAEGTAEYEVLLETRNTLQETVRWLNIKRGE